LPQVPAAARVRAYQAGPQAVRARAPEHSLRTSPAPPGCRRGRPASRGQRKLFGDGLDVVPCRSNWLETQQCDELQQHLGCLRKARAPPRRCSLTTRPAPIPRWRRSSANRCTPDAPRRGIALRHLDAFQTIVPDDPPQTVLSNPNQHLALLPRSAATVRRRDRRTENHLVGEGELGHVPQLVFCQSARPTVSASPATSSSTSPELRTNPASSRLIASIRFLRFPAVRDQDCQTEFRPAGRRFERCKPRCS